MYHPPARCFSDFIIILRLQRPPKPTLFPYTTLFRSQLFGRLPPEELHGRWHALGDGGAGHVRRRDRKSTRLNSSHPSISYAVFCLKKKKRELLSNFLVLKEEGMFVTTHTMGEMLAGF